MQAPTPTEVTDVYLMKILDQWNKETKNEHYPKKFISRPIGLLMEEYVYHLVMSICYELDIPKTNFPCGTNDDTLVQDSDDLDNIFATMTTNYVNGLLPSLPGELKKRMCGCIWCTNNYTVHFENAEMLMLYCIISNIHKYGASNFPISLIHITSLLQSYPPQETLTDIEYRNLLLKVLCRHPLLAEDILMCSTPDISLSHIGKVVFYFFKACTQQLLRKLFNKA